MPNNILTSPDTRTVDLNGTTIFRHVGRIRGITNFFVGVI